MVKKTQAEIEKLFAPHLLEDEEIQWLGEPQSNNWRPRLQALPAIVSWSITLLRLMYFRFHQVIAWLIGLTGVLLMLYLLVWLSGNAFNEILTLIGLYAGPILFWIGLDMSGRKPKEADKPSMAELPRFWESSYFAITNQRIVIFEQGSIRSYSLLLMEDALVSKPNDGASTIYIYDKTNPTGQLPEPILQLKGIAEEEAQSAYEILRQAREEALEDRAREMGIE